MEMPMLEVLVETIRKRIPTFEIRFKDENRFQQVLGFVLRPFNPTYMTKYTTTLYPIVYFPNRLFVERDPEGAWKILAHEYVHLLDTQANPIGFRIRYLLPQLLGTLAILSVFAIWSSWFLLTLVFLAAFFPWSSKGRTELELRGYAMTMAVDYWTGRSRSIPASSKDWIEEQFTGWSYYRMADSGVRTEIDRIAKSIENDEILSGSDSAPYLEVHQLLRARQGYARA
jgi:hypothetical protein